MRGIKNAGQCPKCGVVDWKGGKCAPCKRAYDRKRRADARASDPERVRASVRASYWKHRKNRLEEFYVRKYGLTLADLAAMRESQRGCCAACGDSLGLGNETHVDHDHHTGAVRGLLCRPCNIGIGYLKDSPLRARKIAAYLDRRQPVFLRIVRGAKR